MHHKICLILCLVLFGQATFSQTITVKKDSEVSIETKKQAVALLHETFGEVNNLRTLENRLGFSSELASMLWYEDEKESRAMFTAMIGDFSQLLGQYDSQINSLGGDSEESEYYGGSSFFGGGDQSERGKILRKFSTAMRVRQQIASSLAEHDAKFAFDFYDNSLRSVSNPKLRKQFESQDTYFQNSLLQRVAENDPVNAVEYGRKSLAKGLNYQQVELLKKIYAKDADKGAEFAQALMDKLKTEKISNDDENFYVLSSAFQTGAENFEKAKKDGKKPMFSEENLRALAEIYGQTVLRNSGADVDGRANLELLEKYAPARAAQIQAKIKLAQANKSVTGNSSRIITPTPVPPPAPDSVVKIDKRKESAEQLAESMKLLDGQKLPKEEREKVVAQARKIIAEQTPDKLSRILALSTLAAQVAKAGDQELAGQIMSDASGLINLQPKNYQDYLEVLMLASGYAQTSPDKAFPLLEDSIFRINETLAALVKIGEFIDVSGDMINNGEVQIGTLGDGGLGEITRGLAMADGTIRRLAIADFPRTKALTDKFDRPEARILAKMLILRAVLDKKPELEKAVTDN